MPLFLIERQYLLPVYEQLVVEAATVADACREAIDEGAYPWGNRPRQDFDNAGAVTIARAVALPDNPGPDFRVCEDPGTDVRGALLYSPEARPLPIPAEFTQSSDRARR
ncbi:MAG: hypothetical protein JO038_01685 [Alphaproteobacteria bacterium]|nr:hypothetical protein [Alphaproteobacteria bacterium]